MDLRTRCLSIILFNFISVPNVLPVWAFLFFSGATKIDAGCVLSLEL